MAVDVLTLEKLKQKDEYFIVILCILSKQFARTIIDVYRLPTDLNRNVRLRVFTDDLTLYQQALFFIDNLLSCII